MDYAPARSPTSTVILSEQSESNACPERGRRGPAVAFTALPLLHNTSSMRRVPIFLAAGRKQDRRHENNNNDWNHKKRRSNIHRARSCTQDYQTLCPSRGYCDEIGLRNPLMNRPHVLAVPRLLKIFDISQQRTPVIKPVARRNIVPGSQNSIVVLVHVPLFFPFLQK